MKRILITASLLALLLPKVFGQGCSLCTKTAGELDEKSAKGLNTGILYLALLPLGIMGTVGVVWWRMKK